MIRTNEGEVKLQGGISTLQAELACTIMAVNEAFADKLGADKAKELVTEAFEDAFKSEEELKEEAMEEVKNLLKSLFEEVCGGK